MSEKNTSSKRPSPLAGSALFQNTQEQAALPPLPTTQESAQETAPLQEVKTPPSVQETPLLYLSPPSAEYITRPFDRQYDKQALNANPYLIGAVEAIGKLLRMTKTEMYEEMMRDFIQKHKETLDQRADVVRLYEEKYREKHNL